MNKYILSVPICVVFSSTVCAQSAPVNYSEQLNLAQQALAASPNDAALVRAVYQTAARLDLYPLQEKLIDDYPQVFSTTDKLWLKHDKAVFLSRSGVQNEQVKPIEQALDLLNQVVADAPANSAVAIKSQQDRVVVLTKLRRYEQAVREYEALSEQPAYVKEAYADALMGLSRPFKALDVYLSLPTPNKRKLISAYSDTGHYEEAQQLLSKLPQAPKVGDFTRTSLVRNPEYAEHNFTRIQLTAWRGNTVKANQMIDEWLASAPSDAWGWMLKGDIERWQDKPDDALVAYQKALDLMPNKTDYLVFARMANVYLDQDNQEAARAQMALLPINSDEAKNLTERMELDKTAQLSVSYARQRMVSQSDEVSADMRLYNPKNDAGHRLFVHYSDAQSPKNNTSLSSSRVGAGVELQLHPFDVRLEVGQGLKLNKRAYAWLDANYRQSQHWNFGIKLKLNSDQTPISALKDGVYAKGADLTAQYTANERFRAGASINVLDFSDGNLRRNASLWLSHDWIRHDRWRLNFMGHAEVSKNKQILSATYFNPQHDGSLNGQLSLSYRLPMDNKVSWNQTLSAGAGRYWQAGYQASNTWIWSYGHEWSLGSRWGLGYEAGRKKSIYDGVVEFKNFASAHVNVRF